MKHATKAVTEAFEARFGTQYRALMAELDGKGTDPDHAVHAARTGIRRLRSMLGLYGRRLTMEGHAMDWRLRQKCRALSTMRDAKVVLDVCRKLTGLLTTPDGQYLLDMLADRHRILVAAGNDVASIRAAGPADDHIETTLAHVYVPLSMKQVAHAIRRSARRMATAQAAMAHGITAQRTHTLRRRVRRLRMQLEVVKAMGWKKELRTYLPRSMNLSVRKLERLGRSLGDQHDVALFDAALGGMPPAILPQPLHFRAAMEAGRLVSSSIEDDTTPTPS